jgi:hypothetical protein
MWIQSLSPILSISQNLELCNYDMLLQNGFPYACLCFGSDSARLLAEEGLVVFTSCPILTNYNSTQVIPEWS